MTIIRKLSMLLKQLLVPKQFYLLINRILPGLSSIVIILISIGLIAGLYLAPADYQQGDGFRIIYIHVPSAFLSLLIYVVMALSAAVYYIWNIKTFDLIASSSVIPGMSFTSLALVTGSLWGKPMWGTWWIWDARLTSELILLFMYFGYWLLRSIIPDWRIAGRASAILALIGLVDIPIIHYSVYWWNTLHQKSSLLTYSPTIDTAMLYPLLIMLVGLVMSYTVILLLRIRNEILVRFGDKLFK